MKADVDLPVPNFVEHRGLLTGADATYTGQAFFKFAIVTRTTPVIAFWKNDNGGIANIGQTPVTEPAASFALQVNEGSFAAFLGTGAAGNAVIPYVTFSHPTLRVRAWYRKGATGVFTQLADVDIPAVGYAMQIPDNTITTAKIAANAVKSAQISDGAIIAGKLAGNAVTSANVATGAIKVGSIFTPLGAAATGQVLSYDGTNLSWTLPATGGGASIWALNATSQAIFAGSVGIGANPALAKLDVRGNMLLESGGSPALFTGTGTAELNRYLALINSPSATSASGLKAGGILISDDYGFANPSKIDLIVKGKIAIGTPTFQNDTRITIRTTPGLAVSKYGFEQTDGTTRLASYVGDGILGAGIGTRTAHPMKLFVNNQQYGITLDTAGNVGIGTDTPARNLHLYNATSSVSQRIQTGGGTNAWSQVELTNANGQWNVGTSRNFLTDSFYIQRQGLPATLTLDKTGNAARFTVSDLMVGSTARRGSPGRAVVDYADSLHINFNGDWPTTVIGGTVTQVTTLRIQGGSDLAEPFPMKEESLDKGSVVVIDDEHPGRLKQSHSAYDRRVAGIVSGANGVRPGISLQQEGVLDGGQNVALSGRVYVKADTSGGAIKPGDLLTTSENPGQAMKVTDNTRAQGAIIGKAMGSLSEGEGMVLVLVTLQ